MKRNAMWTVWVLVGLMFTALPAFPDQVPDTGQALCYDDQGNVINCPVPGGIFYGQDANYLINPFSYTKLDASGNPLSAGASSWSMAQDDVTGLVWEVKANDGSIHDKDDTYTWNDSGNFITALNNAQFGGYTDWRMPSVQELSFLGDFGIPMPEPTISSSYFPNTVSAAYRSGTSCSALPAENAGLSLFTAISVGSH